MQPLMNSITNRLAILRSCTTMSGSIGLMQPIELMQPSMQNPTSRPWLRKKKGDKAADKQLDKKGYGKRFCSG